MRHKRIWLQVDEDEVSWCQDQVHDSDVEYELVEADDPELMAELQEAIKDTGPLRELSTEGVGAREADIVIEAPKLRKALEEIVSCIKSARHGESTEWMEIVLDIARATLASQAPAQTLEEKPWVEMHGHCTTEPP